MLKPKILIKVLYSNSTKLRNWYFKSQIQRYTAIRQVGDGTAATILSRDVTDVIDNQQCPSYLAYVFNVWESKAQRNTKRC